MTGRPLKAALIATVLGLSACSPIVRNHGYAPSEQTLSEIQVGRDTRADVAELVGNPSAAGILTDRGWYYVQSQFETIGPRQPQEVDRQVVAISFSDGGVVTNIERFGLEDGRVVALSRRVTDSSVADVSFLGQLFSNIGVFNAADLIGDE